MYESMRVKKGVMPCQGAARQTNPADGIDGARRGAAGMTEASK
jgi:hypothetical protein